MDSSNGFIRAYGKYLKSNVVFIFIICVDQTGDISQALQKLTEPKVAKMYNIPSLSNVVHSASSRLAIKPGQAPINGDTLTTLLEVSYISTKFVLLLLLDLHASESTGDGASQNVLAKIYLDEIKFESDLSHSILMLFWCIISLIITMNRLMRFSQCQIELAVQSQR